MHSGYLELVGWKEMGHGYKVSVRGGFKVYSVDSCTALQIY